MHDGVILTAISGKWCYGAYHSYEIWPCLHCGVTSTSGRGPWFYEGGEWSNPEQATTSVQTESTRIVFCGQAITLVFVYLLLSVPLTSSIMLHLNSPHVQVLFFSRRIITWCSLAFLFEFLFTSTCYRPEEWLHTAHGRLGLRPRQHCKTPPSSRRKNWDRLSGECLSSLKSTTSILRNGCIVISLV